MIFDKEVYKYEYLIDYVYMYVRVGSDK